MESVLGFRMMRKFVLDRFWIPHHAEEEILKKLNFRMMRKCDLDMVSVPHCAEVGIGFWESSA